MDTTENAGFFDQTGASAGPSTTQISPRGTWRQQAAVLAVALGAITLVTNEFLPVALLGAIRASLHVSEGLAATMVTAPAVMAGISAPALAVLVGRTDRRLVLI